MLPSTSIRHIRFSDALMIEQILLRIELIMRGIEQRSIDTNIAETQLRAALNHIMRLQSFLPAQEHS